MTLKVKHRGPLTGKKLLQLMRQLRADVRTLAAHVSPPIRPEEYATASYSAQELLTQLHVRDAKDEGRQGILVPILLYDALLTSSIKGLIDELAQKGAPYAGQDNSQEPQGISTYGAQDPREEAIVGEVRDQG